MVAGLDAGVLRRRLVEQEWALAAGEDVIMSSCQGSHHGLDVDLSERKHDKRNAGHDDQRAMAIGDGGTMAHELSILNGLVCGTGRGKGPRGAMRPPQQGQISRDRPVNRV